MSIHRAIWYATYGTLHAELVRGEIPTDADDRTVPDNDRQTTGTTDYPDYTETTI